MTRASSWRRDAATAYLDTLQSRGLSLDVQEGCLLLPPGETDSEVELVRLLKPELLAMIRERQAGPEALEAEARSWAACEASIAAGRMTPFPAAWLEAESKALDDLVLGIEGAA
jgi:hypothetical protein